jgi:protein-tyrosine phosphatase
MPSVLFVCTANRFRSPLAAGIFRKALVEEEKARTSPWNIGDSRDWKVGSAGTWTVPGQAVLPVVLEAAKAFDIDLSNHRSAQVSAQLLSEHDLILVMQESQKEALQSEFPHLNEYIYLLSHVVELGTYDIPDTFGSLQEVMEVCAEMNELIRRGLRYICVLAVALHNKRNRLK